MNKIAVGVILICIFLIGTFLWFQSGNSIKKTTNTATTKVQEINASYSCNGGKIIDATFIKGEPKTVKSGEPPLPGGKVNLILNDGRNITLSQTISADGSRYANKDESFVFWSKGNSALILENNIENNYKGCMVIASDPGDLPNVYTNGETGFSVRYPADYILNSNYQYQGLGPGKNIAGVKFTIPGSLAQGTNLSSFDTGVSVESLPETNNCDANLFLPNRGEIKIINENGKEYSYASIIQRAAGNRYEEDVFAVSGSNPCFAVRYLIHSTNISNYPPGQVKEFNRSNLIATFDKIRRSLIIN